MLIAGHSVVSRNDAVMFTDLGDTVITMNIDSGNYHELNSVASRIWQMIETPISVRDLCRRLVSEYNVEASDCERDVVEFLGDFYRLQLVNVSD